MKIIVFVMLMFYSLAWATNEDFFNEARVYRSKGYEAQTAGDIEMALVYYKKSSALDPFYAIPHNDAGIVFEIKGYLDKALNEYIAAIQINPDFAEAHMNLGLLYERMNEIEKALVHFAKRAELGKTNDSWTKRAWEKIWKYAPEMAKEIEAKVLAQEIAGKLKEDKESNKILAAKHYQKGVFYFKKKLFENAYNELKQAIHLAPDNLKYQEMYSKSNSEYKIQKINIHVKNGTDFLNSNENVKAKQEFEKILELIPRDE
ncbi:MAG: tetratricopeptide repeat protein [Candidatus Saelkia tenebricola]|nr:tetratricopeptide repeat protein [Candidatus Saelkia tenebricola]